MLVRVRKLISLVQRLLGIDNAEKVDRIFDTLRGDDDEYLAMGELNVWRKKLFRRPITQPEYVS